MACHFSRRRVRLRAHEGGEYRRTAARAAEVRIARLALIRRVSPWHDTAMKRRSFLQQAGGGLLAAAASGQAPTNDGRIKIGQIGVKHAHAHGKMEAIRKLAPHYEVVGVVEADPSARAAAKSAKAFEGLPFLTEEQLFNVEGLKTVAVETEVADLVPTARRCVDAGFYVHLDKPAGPSLPAFRALLEAAQAKQVVVQMGYMLRYNPAFQFCFRAVREGWLGTLFELHAVMSKTSGAAARKEMARFSGGAMFELGCHIIDAAVHVLGKPETVTPFLQKTREDGLADNTLAVLQYPRATATIRSALMEVNGFQRRQFVVCGDQGTLDIRPLEPPELHLRLAKPQGPFFTGNHEVDLPAVTGRYDGEFIDLARIIRKEKEPDFSAEHDLHTHETILKASGMPTEA